MNWKKLHTIEITEGWQLITIKSEILRITHLSVPIEKDYIKGVYTQAFQDIDGMLTIFNPQLLSCRQEREIIHLPNLIKDLNSIAFKRLDKNIDIIWKIEVEYYEI